MRGPGPTPRRSPGPARAGAVAAAVLLATGAAACLDFADPVEPEPGPGRFDASVLLADGEPATLEVEASFEPGAVPGGRIRSPADPSLRVLATTVEPSPDLTRDPGRLRYRATDTLDAGELDRAELVIEGPRLSAERPRAVRTLPLIWRTGPDSVRLVEGEDLELPLRGADATEGEDLRLQWRLDVNGSRGTGPLYTASGRSVIPDTLEVPAEVLEAAGAGEPLRANVRIQVTTRSPSEGSGYESFLQVSTRLEWRVAPP